MASIRCHQGCENCVLIFMHTGACWTPGTLVCTLRCPLPGLFSHVSHCGHKSALQVSMHPQAFLFNAYFLNSGPGYLPLCPYLPPYFVNSALLLPSGNFLRSPWWWVRLSMSPLRLLYCLALICSYTHLFLSSADTYRRGLCLIGLSYSFTSDYSTGLSIQPININ